MTQMLRRGAIYLSFFSIMLAVVAIGAIGIDYIFWRIHVGGLESTERPKAEVFETIPNVPAKTLQRLGRIYTDKKNSFVNFDRQKPPGVIRIGAFGDSFTYGDEVDEKSDYPAQLQKLLRESRVPNAEVLNFGTPWYGFGQTHIMWNELGRYFNLDYILLGPVTFFPERDTRFNHTYGLSPYYLHSRYVLDEDGLQLIDIPGQSYAERFRNYYSFIPDRRVLLYDRGDPAFLAALLPRDSYVGNPFYYNKRNAGDEAVEIQKRLLQDMEKAGTPIIAAVYPWINAIKQATNGLASEKLCITQFSQLIKFPYRAQYDHNSPTGNALLARQYLAALLGRTIGARIIHTVDRDKNATLPSVKGELSSFDGVYIKLDGVDAGVFAPSYPPQGPAKSPSFLRDGKFNSLIALKAAQDSVLDGIFLAFPSDISTTAPVRIVMQSSKESESADLGPLRPLADGLNLGQADLPGLEVRDTSFGERRIIMNAAALSGLFADISSSAKLQVFIGDKAVLEGSGAEESGKFVLRPLAGELAIIRGARSNDLSTDDGPEKGNIDIVLKRGTDAHSIPIAQWWIENRQLEPPAECIIKPLLTTNPVTIAVMASGDQFEGAPQMRIYLDDRPIGDAQVTAEHKAGEWQTFIFNAEFAVPAAVLKLALVNDKFDEATEHDRNLYIREISVDSLKLRLEDGVISGAPAAGIPGEPRPIYNGSLAFSLGPAD